MKKQVLILLTLIFILLGSEQIIFGQTLYKETEISIINKLSANYADDKIFLELIGNYYNINSDDIRINFNKDGGVITIERVFFDPNISNEINRASIALPQVQEIGLIEITELGSQIQLAMEYSHLKFLEKSTTISDNKISFVFEIDLAGLSRDAEVSGIFSIDKKPDFVVSKLYAKPDRLNVTILHNDSTKIKAYQLSQKLLQQKIKIEKDLENSLNIVNITKIPLEDFGHNIIYFRENYYLSAIYFSDLLKDVYIMMPFIHPERKKDVDLEILIID